ncbi:hypothetical protein WN943_020913 [Citrus x changshan-huyou]
MVEESKSRQEERRANEGPRKARRIRSSSLVHGWCRRRRRFARGGPTGTWTAGGGSGHVERTEHNICVFYLTVVLGGVEPPERSLSRKGSSNEGSVPEERRNFTLAGPRRVSSDAWDARDRQKAVTNWSFSFNPGPFNIKEHVLITIFSSCGASGVYAVHIIAMLRAFYKRSIHPVAALLLALTTQMLGYGWAGIFRRYLVDSPYMWWPANLVQVSLFRIHFPFPYCSFFCLLDMEKTCHSSTNRFMTEWLRHWCYWNRLVYGF